MAWIWTARGEASNVILWMGAVAAVLICVAWFVSHLDPYFLQVETVDQDLLDFEVRFNEACNSRSYASRFNPVTERGELHVEGQQACIRADKISRCRPLQCASGLNETLNLKKLIWVALEKRADGQQATFELRGSDKP